MRPMQLWQGSSLFPGFEATVSEVVNCIYSGSWDMEGHTIHDPVAPILEQSWLAYTASSSAAALLHIVPAGHCQQSCTLVRMKLYLGFRVQGKP